MNIYLFGKSSLSGEAFFEYFNSKKIKIKFILFQEIQKCNYKLDLTNPSTFNLVE